MKTYVLNLFIVDYDNLKLLELRNYLDNRFGTSISISIFNDSDSMLKKIERYTNDADFALVLYTPCDHGCGVHEVALRSRAHKTLSSNTDI